MLRERYILAQLSAGVALLLGIHGVYL